MSDTLIKVEDVGKLYKLGAIGTGTISHDLNRWMARVRGKEDPFAKIGQTNDRTAKGSSDYVWALKDVSFEVKQGEVLGIIGRNGAGKSTLLKILSKVTTPSVGQIKIKGRIASLLEVGTGFHPELTGRENIFLNGAILGMTKGEIRKKFDAIVDFAGVERYIDTPVKRYSSGMYVRLAFAVAAFLEPEILIVDEVLAVGDAEFQKKCLGRMQDVSTNEGRTVLFVSHDMGAVSTLTEKVVVLNKGTIDFNGLTGKAITKYLQLNKAGSNAYTAEPNGAKPTVTRVEVRTSEHDNIHAFGKPLFIDCEVSVPMDAVGNSISIQIFNMYGYPIVYTWLFDTDTPFARTAGRYRLSCELPACKLYKGNYYLKVHLANTRTREVYGAVDNICGFKVEMLNQETIEWGWQDNVCAYLEDFKWHNHDTKILY